MLGENFVESNLVGLSTQKPNNTVVVNVYPNPAKDDVTFEIKNADQNNYTLQLFNTTGSSVLQRNISNNKTTIQKGSLPAGIYFYQVSQPQGITGVGKLIIN